MKMLVCFLALLTPACLEEGEPIADGDLASTDEALISDDLDLPPTGGEPILSQGPFQEIRPFEVRCSVAATARVGYGVLGTILPRGPLGKPVRVLVWQGQNKLVSLPVTSGGFSIQLSRSVFPNRFPGSFVTCIKNPGANTVSVDAQATILIGN